METQAAQYRNSSQVSTTEFTGLTKNDFYIGLGLAISSSLFIGSSFIIKKKALLRLGSIGKIRAGSGGHGYLRDWMWWIGLSSMGLGEALNFAAYAFAPASLVTPLGALSVLVSAVLSSKFLNEHLNILGKIGCFLCIIGSTIIVIHAATSGDVSTMEELWLRLMDPVFMGYAMIAVGLSVILILYCGPRYGSTNIVIYILSCSLIGSLSVMSVKGIGIAIKETFAGVNNEFSNWLTWFFLVSLVLFIVVQMNYLNKALDIFNTSMVTPIYYVFFTTFVITASTILFGEWKRLLWKDILGNVCGFMVIITGIFLLHAFKDMELSLANFRSKLRRNANNSHLMDNEDVENNSTTCLLTESNGRLHD
ncbi:hypothetical protein CHUAL_001573 [Chamberlinius hualienensis]